MKIADLKPYVDKTITLRMTDGEIAKVRVGSISEEYDDINCGCAGVHALTAL